MRAEKEDEARGKTMETEKSRGLVKKRSFGMKARQESTDARFIFFLVTLE